MKGQLMERALWCAAVMITLVGGLAIRAAVPHPRPPAARSWAPPRAAVQVLPESLLAAAQSITATDPFRLERRPSSIAFNPQLGGATPPPPPPKPPKPPLAVAGLVGGPPWAALLDGIPGHASTVLVRTGSVIGELRVRSVSRTHVVITGMDTVWTLSLKRPWQ